MYWTLVHIFFFFFANSLSMLQAVHLIINHFSHCRAISQLPKHDTAASRAKLWPSGCLSLSAQQPPAGDYMVCSTLSGQSLMLSSTWFGRDASIAWQADRVFCNTGCVQERGWGGMRTVTGSLANVSNSLWHVGGSSGNIRGLCTSAPCDFQDSWTRPIRRRWWPLRE